MREFGIEPRRHDDRRDAATNDLMRQANRHRNVYFCVAIRMQIHRGRFHPRALASLAVKSKRLCNSTRPQKSPICPAVPARLSWRASDFSLPLVDSDSGLPFSSRGAYSCRLLTAARVSPRLARLRSSHSPRPLPRSRRLPRRERPMPKPATSPRSPTRKAPARSATRLARPAPKKPPSRSPSAPATSPTPRSGCGPKTNGSPSPRRKASPAPPASVAAAPPTKRSKRRSPNVRSAPRRSLPR